MNRRRKAAPGVHVQQKQCIQKQSTSLGDGLSSNCYNSNDDHDSFIDGHDGNGNERHGYHPRACIKPSEKCRYSTSAAAAITTTTTTKQRFCLTVLRNAIVRTILQQQQKNLQPLVLMIFIPICLWINAIAVSSSSFFHNQFQWTKHYPDAPFRPRMLLLHPLEDTTLKYVTRLSLKEDVVLQSLQQQQQQQQQRALQKSTTRKLDSPWDNHGPIRTQREPDDMRTRDTCIYLADWQLAYHPSCNDIHSVDLPSTSSTAALISNGVYRDVWKIPDNSIRTGHHHHHDGGDNDAAQEQQPRYCVLKTLRYLNKRIFDLRNFDRHRRDAIAFQELQSSKHVMGIHGHCANSALFDFSKGGDLWGLFGSRSKQYSRNDSFEDDNNNSTINNNNSRQRIDNNDERHSSTSSISFVLMSGETEDDESKPEPTKFQLLQIAHSIASAVADAHHFDSLGRPTMAHTDIKPDQWILVSSSKSSSRTSGGSGAHDSKNKTSTTTSSSSFLYQLGDFSRARFLTWDTVHHETCPFQVDKNGGRWRSPEEYNHENQTEKGDVWSLGNMLYFLISEGKPPFGDLDDDDAIKRVKKGGHPTIDEYYHELTMTGTTSNNATKNDNDNSLLFLDIMGNAMMSCFEFDPRKRPSAHQIVAILQHGLVTWASNKKKKKTRNQ